MSDETPVAEEQLFDSDDSEVTQDQETDSDEEIEESSDEEHDQDLDLQLEENKEPTSKAEESKLAQIKAFQKKIKAGDFASSKDLPKAQKWMKDFLHFPDKEAKLDTDSLRTELLEAAKADREAHATEEQFNTFLTSLNEKATPEQKEFIEFSFKDLREKGLSKLDAAELSAELAQVDFDGQKERREAMRIPTPGSTKGRKPDPSSMDFDEYAKKVPEKVSLAYLESLQ